ncbi:MAG: Nif3-like dinuclear metal center hexameric protein [Ignavibacteria bacterium]|jgi:dinuclear metal center YbgI/SA1388 family protein
MHCIDLIKYMEDWAPPGVAWERDNTGLQIGSVKRKIKNILLSLELNKEVLNEALSKNCNFIFTHHPLIFNPIKKLDLDKDEKSQLVETIIKNDITVYSAHTNLDFTKDGVSFELANVLGLENRKFLVNQDSNQVKLVVFVPEGSVDKVADAIFESGGGIIGEYDNCSYGSQGYGTFKGSENSSPVIGEKENFEKVNEVRLEVLVDSWKLKKVIKNLIASHPYEEPAYDIYPLKNENVNYGYGVIGDLTNPLTTDEFLKHVCSSLNIEAVKHSTGKNGSISKVAVCGGSGSDLLKKAIQKDADAFVTADIKYHSFEVANGKILFVDAGHYETEINILNNVQKKLEKFLHHDDEINVYKFEGTTNPVKFFKM